MTGNFPLFSSENFNDDEMQRCQTAKKNLFIPNQKQRRYFASNLKFKALNVMGKPNC